MKNRLRFTLLTNLVLLIVFFSGILQVSGLDSASESPKQGDSAQESAVCDKDGYVNTPIAKEDIEKADNIEWTRISGNDFSYIGDSSGLMNGVFDFYSKVQNKMNNKIVIADGEFHNAIYQIDIVDNIFKKKLVFDFSSIYPTDNLTSYEGTYYYNNRMFLVNNQYVFCKQFLYYPGFQRYSFKSSSLDKYIVINGSNKPEVLTFKLNLSMKTECGYSILDLSYQNGKYYLLIGEHRLSSRYGIAYGDPLFTYRYQSSNLKDWVFLEKKKGAGYDEYSAMINNTFTLVKKYKSTINSIEKIVKASVPLKYYEMIYISPNSGTFSGKGNAYTRVREAKELVGANITYLLLDFELVKDDDSYPIPVILSIDKKGNHKIVEPKDLVSSCKAVYNFIQSKDEFQKNTLPLFKKLDSFYKKKIMLTDDEINKMKQEIIKQNAKVCQAEKDYIGKRSIFELKDLYSISNKYLLVSNDSMIIKKTGYIPVLTASITYECDDNVWMSLASEATSNNGYLLYYSTYNETNSIGYYYVNKDKMNALSLPFSGMSMDFYSIIDNTIYATYYCNQQGGLLIGRPIN